MTDPSKALLDYLRKVGMGLQPDFLREAIRVMSELLMDLEARGQIGAERYERSEKRTTRRNGVQLVISDAHEGLKTAIGQVFTGATWQRCRVHCLRTLLAHVPEAKQALVAAAVRTIFAQPNRQAAGQQLQEVVQALQGRWPDAARTLTQAEEDILAYMAFPQDHWTRISSTNVLERLNKEVKRRTDVVGVFPDVPSMIRLVGAALLESDDEWQIERRYFSLEPLTTAQAMASSPLRLAPVR
jgi:transposase-like protein